MFEAKLKSKTWLKWYTCIWWTDYRFLEDAGRKKDNTTRDELKRKREKPNFVSKVLYGLFRTLKKKKGQKQMLLRQD